MILDFSVLEKFMMGKENMDAIYRTITNHSGGAFSDPVPATNILYKFALICGTEDM